MSPAKPGSPTAEGRTAAADERFANFVEHVGSWANSFPHWPPAAEVAEVWREVQPRLAAAVEELGRPLVVGVLGGTGTGKSTLVNALAGRDVSEASDVARPTTISPVVVAATSTDLDWFPIHEIGATIVRTEAEAVAEIVLVDCPDPDTQGITPPGEDGGPDTGGLGNRDRLEQILPRCDVLLVVSTAQKYRSFSVARELRAFAPGRPLLFVQTHATRDPDIRDDWQRDLERQGFAVPVIYRVDGLEASRATAARQPVEQGFAELQAAIAGHLAAREAGRIRRNGGLELAGWFLDRGSEQLEPVHGAVRDLCEGVGRETQRLEVLVAAGIAQQVQQARLGWRHLVANELQQQWQGGCFGWFLQFVASLGAWLPKNRRQLSGLVGRTLAGQVPTLSAAEATPQTPSPAILEEALGLDDAEVEQSRSVLAGLARRAAIQAPLVQPARQQPAAAEGPVGEALSRGQRWLVTGIKQVAEGCRERIGGRGWQMSFELLFDAVLLAVVARAAWDFFHGRLWLGESRGGLLMEAAVWLLLWGLLLKQVAVAWAARRLQRDLDKLAGSHRDADLVTPLLADFAAAGAAAAAFLKQRDQLETNWATVEGDTPQSPPLAHLQRDNTSHTKGA